MDYNEQNETVINNEYDYSNAIATADNIGYLVQYCEQLYNQLLELIQEDEEKNKKLKYEFKNHNYEKYFGTGFEVIIKDKNYSMTTIKGYNAYLEAVNKGQLREVDSLEINLELSYRRGKADSLEDYKNSFKIIFKPYEIKFRRQSNHDEPNVNQMEATICGMLDKYPVENTIFCTK